MRFSASDDRLQLWLDGAIAYDATFDANAFDETVTDNGGAAASGLFVGEANFSGGLPDLGKYSGQIDDVALFHAALTPDDLALLAGGATPTAGTYPTAIDTELPDGTSRAQLRLVFDVDDPAALTGMVVEARYDDALLLWLNGELVAERGATVGAEAAATDRDDSLVAVPASIPLPTELLVAGQNVLAAEVLAADGSASAYLDLAVTASTDTLGMLASESPGAPNGPLMSGGVLFSSPSLTFAGPFTLELTGPAPGAVVRYTTDGSEPGEASTLYEGPITVDRTMELRARAWEEGLGAGPVSQRLFVEVAPDLRDTVRDLPVIVMISPGIGASWSPAPLLAFDAGDDLGADAAFAGPASAHVRGQSSASQPKQPYRLELRDARGHDASHPLLGLSDDADWVLHAPYVDKSLMRNALAFELGRAAGLDAPATAYAHLYVGEPGEALTDAHYRGVYVLMETIEISSDRLDLASIGPEVDSEPELSGAYLLKFEADVAESPILAGWSTLELAEPDPVTDVQLDWIADHIADFDAVLFSGDFADPATGYAAWIDVGSWVDTVILHELFRDQDAYVRSAWFYKDQEGPLVMGPLWDFNLVAGTGGYFGNTDLEGWQWAHGYNAGEHGWFERLMTDPAFADAVQDRWWTLRAGALSDEAMAATIATHAAALESGAADNFALWDNLGDPSVNGFVSPATDTWAQQVDALADWLAARSAWIDGELD